MQRLSSLPLAVIVASCAQLNTGNETHNDAPSVAEFQAEAKRLVELFDEESLATPISTVPCTLSEGVQTTCLSVTLKPEPASFTIGPWCPRNIKDGPEDAGIWLEGGKVYDADGKFIQNLPEFYEDEEFQLFDPATGNIRVTDSKLSCQAAARPNVAEEYRKHCVECEVSYMEADASQTYVIPLIPVAATRIAPRIDHVGVGVAFSGARLDAAAPTDAILAAHTLAPFDDCGGHVNLNAGYHLHAVTNCLKSYSTADGHAEQIGLAMDGHAILSRVNSDGSEPTDLDQCRGHVSAGMSYHYHAAKPGKNAIIGCHSGQTGCALDDQNDNCDASATQRRRPPPDGQRPPR